MAESVDTHERYKGEETTAEHALELHNKTKNIIATELGIGEIEAEQEVGEYFLEKVDSDLQTGATHEILTADVDATLISGVAQVEMSDDTVDDAFESLSLDALAVNPIGQLEESHPALVTEGIVDLASTKKTSKIAEVASIITERVGIIINSVALRLAERKDVHPVEASVELTSEEIARRLEREGTVKLAPKFVEQKEDLGRTNQIITVAGLDKAVGTDTSSEEYRSRRVSMTEHDALVQLDDFLEGIIATGVGGEAASMRESLTFVGEKEYLEAAAGIATYWKSELDRDPDLTILALSGEIARDTKKYVDNDGGQQVKSDDFLLEHILENFSDEELSKYNGRLLVDYSEEIDKKTDKLKVIFVDDWTISGLQLRAAAKTFIDQYPTRKKSVEIQLVAASEKRIKGGLRAPVDRGQFVSFPLRAYYTAHSAESGHFSGTHITGFHSSVDYDFENKLADMVQRRRSFGVDATMAGPTNIVRPYRYDGIKRDTFFVHKDRVRAHASA